MECWKQTVPLFACLTLAAAAPANTLRARAPVSELVIDADSGHTLFAAAAERRRPPASLAKMMTLLLAFEAIDRGRLRLDDTLRVSAHAAAMPPSRLGIAPGGQISIADAIRTIAVISANDIAVALAERLARGTEAAAVRLMNRRAVELGMTSTSFTNATGLAPGGRGGITTARDMALLARLLVKRSHDYRVFATRLIRWHGQVRSNHNRLLGHVAGVDGIKTGYTVPAGFNLAASARRHDRRIIVVVLGAHSLADRDLRVANLIESGFSALVPRNMAAGGAAPETGLRSNRRTQRPSRPT